MMKAYYRFRKADDFWRWMKNDECVLEEYISDPPFPQVRVRMLTTGELVECNLKDIEYIEHR